MKLLDVQSCINALLEQAAKTVPPKQETLSLIDAHDHVLAENIYATVDVPPADNSAMDGYVINTADLEQYAPEQSVSFPISQRIHAGAAPTSLQPSTAARIFTGAEIPAGADCVIIQENCVETEANSDDSSGEDSGESSASSSNSSSNNSSNNSWVSFKNSFNAQDNIRPKGQDIEKDGLVLAKGSRLAAAEIGLLASIGVPEVQVYKPLTIAIVNTGDELVEPGTELKPGQIYNSNRFLLDGMLKNWGFKTVHTAITQDSLEATQTALAEVSEQSDLIITTGGVSVGDSDFVKPAVAALGALDIWKIAIKPGKPFAFGHVKHTPFIGLPGNPASVFVTLSILAKPFLLAVQGIDVKAVHPVYASAVAEFDRKASWRETYLRARFEDGKVVLHPNQSSGVLSSTSWGNCLVRQMVDEEITQGSRVSILLY